MCIRDSQKGDSDAASWLPSNKPFRCQYVARQAAVKTKYDLWVTQAEQDAMLRVLEACPGEPMPAPGAQPILADNTGGPPPAPAETSAPAPVSYTHLRAHETKANLVCRLLLE